MPSLGLFATACRWRGVLRYSDEQEEEDGKDDEEDDEEVDVDDGEGGEPGCWWKLQLLDRIFVALPLVEHSWA